MALSEQQRERLKAAAREHGVPESDVISSASKMSGQTTEETSDGPSEEAALTAERFLIGFLPYVTVRELRTKVLGLTEAAADDQLFTGEWLAIHGQPTAAAPGVPPTLTGATSDDNSEGRKQVPPTAKGEEK